VEECDCPFKSGDQVTWNEGAPKTFHLIWTPGPMTVISYRWSNGESSEFLKKFEEQFGGEPNVPGWIITIEYDADASGYRDPPMSVIMGKKILQMETHQMWLKKT